MIRFCYALARGHCLYSTDKTLCVYFNDIRMFIWYNTYLCQKAAPGSTLKLYNQISFAYIICFKLQRSNKKGWLKSGIHLVLQMFTLFSLKSHFLSQFPLKQPFSSEMRLLHQGWSASCGMASGAPLSLQKSALALQRNNWWMIGAYCWTKSVCQKKSDEKRFVQWKGITYLFFWMNPVLVSVFFLTGFCNSPGFDSKKQWPM